MTQYIRLMKSAKKTTNSFTFVHLASTAVLISTLAGLQLLRILEGNYDCPYYIAYYILDTAAAGKFCNSKSNDIDNASERIMKTVPLKIHEQHIIFIYALCIQFKRLNCFTWSNVEN